MDHPIPELDAKGLREFAFVTGAILAVLFGIVLPWIFGFSYPLWPWLAALVLVGWGIVAPTTLAPVYRTWMRFGLLMSKVMTPLVMGIVFFLLITPVALVMKLIRRDPMERRLRTPEKSYRVVSTKSARSNVERPY